MFSFVFLLSSPTEKAAKIAILLYSPYSFFQDMS
jgi:hypothetical protein